jgi:trehalose 6-phosphate phosphatase
VSGLLAPRTSAGRAALAAILAEPERALAGETGLVVAPGRFVLELRPPGVDMGAALRTLVESLTKMIVS